MSKKNEIKFTEKEEKKPEIAFSTIECEFAKTSLVRSIQDVAMNYKDDVLKDLYGNIRKVIDNQRLQKIWFKRLPGLSMWLDTIETEISDGDVFEFFRGKDPSDPNSNEYTIGVMATDSDISPTIQMPEMENKQLQKNTMVATDVVADIIKTEYKLFIRKKDKNGVISILTNNQTWEALDKEESELFHYMDGDVTTIDEEEDQAITPDNPLLMIPTSKRKDAVLLARLVRRSQGRLILVPGPGKFGYIAVPACRQDTGMCFAQRNGNLMLCQFVDAGNVDETLDTGSFGDITAVMFVAKISFTDALRFTEMLRTGNFGAEDIYYRIDHDKAMDTHWIIPLSVEKVLEIFDSARNMLSGVEIEDDLTNIEQDKLDSFLGEVQDTYYQRYLDEE